MISLAIERNISQQNTISLNLVSKREIILKYVETEHNKADMLTKPLGSTKLK